jgi:hypothetical protein
VEAPGDETWEPTKEDIEAAEYDTAGLQGAAAEARKQKVIREVSQEEHSQQKQKAERFNRVFRVDWMQWKPKSRVALVAVLIARGI